MLLLQGFRAKPVALQCQAVRKHFFHAGFGIEERSSGESPNRRKGPMSALRTALLIPLSAALLIGGADPLRLSGSVPALADGVLLQPPPGRRSKTILDPRLGLPAVGNPGPARTSYKWFWKEVSVSINAASAGRWLQVLALMERKRAQGVRIFGSRRRVQQIYQAYGPILARAADRAGVSLPLLIAVIAVESNGNRGAVSPKGAQGLMQLMPGTAARFGVTNSLDPAQNIRAGATYLNILLRMFGNDAVLALAGYNAGEGAVKRHGGVPPYRETRDYVAKVAGAYLYAQELCQTRPIGPRDKCVLK